MGSLHPGKKSGLYGNGRYSAGISLLGWQEGGGRRSDGGVSNEREREFADSTAGWGASLQRTGLGSVSGRGGGGARFCIIS